MPSGGMGATFQAKTRYKYMTGDGGPPSAGKPPGAAGSTPSPFGCLMPSGPPPPYPGTGPQICYANAPPPGSMICLPAAPGFRPPPPSGPSYVYAPPPPPPPHSTYPSAPAPSGYPQAHSFQPTGQRKPPRPGARVQGELPVYPDGKAPVLHSPDICTFHFIKSTIKPWDPSWTANMGLELEPYRAATNLTIRQLIEASGAREEAPYHPEWAIGLTEALNNGFGGWEKGTTYTLDPRDQAKTAQTLAQVGWTRDRGEAGGRPPVTLFFEP